MLRQDQSNSDTCRPNHNNQINKFAGSGAKFAGSNGPLSTVDALFNVPGNQASMPDGFLPIPVLGDGSNLCVDIVPHTRAMG
jgi:hypothetical protein